MRTLLPLFLAAALAAPAPAFAQTIHWSEFTVAPRGGALVPGRPDGGAANGPLAAADLQGNLYLVATERHLTQPCLVALKYHASSGAVAWRREVCGGGLTWGAAIAVDRSGDAVVTGAVDGAMRTLKLAGATGVVLWDQRTASAGAGFSVALAPDGDAVVAAHAAGITTDVHVSRLRGADGSAAWQVVVDAGFDEMPAGIAVDRAGDVLVAASFANDRGDGDWLVRKLSGAGGATAWQQTYDSGQRDVPAALAVDGNGNAVVAGTSAIAGGFAIRTVKYTADGRIAWDRSAGTGASGARAVAVDSRGSVFVAGHVQLASGDVDMLTLKYSGDGTPVWSAAFAGGGGRQDAARAIALDAGGNVAVTGFAFPAGHPDPELVTVKYLGANGREMWSHAHRAPGASPETAGHAVVDAAGATLVAGVAQQGGPLGLQVMKLANTLVASARSGSNVQGLWWASPPGSESGWGLNLAQQGTILFATWFTYGEDGEPAWFVVPRAEAQGDNRYAGTMYRTRGPWFGAARFEPSQVVGTPVGAATFDFSDGDHGTFRYAVDGVTGEKPIARQAFAAPMPVCAAGQAPGAAPNYQDLWWAAPAGSESGWGLNIAHQGDVLFVTWFTYGPDGRGTWLVGSRFDRTGNGTYAGVLHRTSGPAFNAARFDPARVASAPAGTASLAFADAGHGVFTFTVDGVSRSKPIARQVFSTPATVCR